MPLDPEPHKFIPERFLLNNKHPFNDLPFSAGPRNYIGTFFSFHGHVL
jgi:cytochrome P450